MKKQSSRPSGNKKELVAFDKRTVDFSKLKTDLSVTEIDRVVGIGRVVIVVPFSPLEVLSPVKTLGRGRTNLTIIRPTIVQIDTSTPFASFDIRSDSSPAISMHFEPVAYGMNSRNTYIMEFTIQAFGQSTFMLGGGVGSGTLGNAGTKILNGLNKVTLVMRDVEHTQHAHGFLQQTAGVAWNWLSVQVRFPDLVISQASA